jgi:hypothetical protein
MTDNRFEAVNEVEQHNLAQKLAAVSEVFSFEKALELVKVKQAKAEWLLRLHEESAKRKEERARTLERLHRATQEFR